MISSTNRWHDSAAFRSPNIMLALRKARKVSRSLFFVDLVSAHKVDFWKDSLTMELLRGILNMGRGIPVGYGAGV